jgi:PAS domain S-box-containing protein
MEALNILHLEDSETDAEIVKRVLKKENLPFNYKLCMSREEYIAALQECTPDVILADNSLPQFDAAEALNIANHLMLQVPFILVTGTMSEEFAVDMIKRGADDYILKDRLGRLPSAIDTALKKRRAEKEKSMAMEQLVQSEEKYRMLFERNLAGVYLTTVAGTIISCNDAFAAMLGYSSHLELEQKSAFSLYFDSGHRDEFIINLRNKKQVSNYESVLKHKNGNVVNILENISLLVDAVTGEEMIEGVMLDFTEHKQMQEALLHEQYLMQTLMNNLPDCIYFKDHESRFLRVSKSQARWLGVDEPSMALGKTDHDFFHKDHAEAAFSDEMEIIQTGQSITREEKELWPNGTVTYSISTKMPLRNQQGDITGTFGISRDITERKKAEILIQQSEEKYRTLVEQAFDGIIIYAPDGSILDCNLSACTYTGYSANELKGFNVTKLFFKEELEARPLNFELLYSGHATLDYRRVKQKDGSAIDMEIATKIMPDGRLMALGRDITERKKAQAQQALFASIVNSSDDAIISINLDGSITSWNRGAEALYGYSEKEMIGQNISMLVPKHIAGEEITILNIIAGGDNVQHYETERLRKDGSHVFVSLTVSPVRNSKGVITGASKIARDITGRKAAEQKIIESQINLKTIFDNTSEGFVLVDAAGEIKAFNDKTKKSIFANTKAEMEVGKSIFDFVDDDRKDFFEQVIKSVLRGSPVQYDRAYAQDNGKLYWINLSLNPVIKDKKIDGFCITGRDITERKIAEEQLNKSYAEKQVLAHRMSTIINTLPANIALLDENGIIVDVNEAWKNFADQNGFAGNNYAVGGDYIDISNRSFGEDESDGKKVAEGIKKVLKKKIKAFEFEYPCHSPEIQRWFRMVVTPIAGKEQPGAVVMHIDISELRKLEAERIESKVAEQKNITQAMILGQEKERNAIGRELHDNMNQILAGVNLLLGMLRTRPERLSEYLPLCIENINLAIAENRKIAHELVSPNQVSESLINQISRLCTNMLQNAGLKTTIDHDQFDEYLVRDDQKLAIYRVVQEQCSNIVKYAQAGNVEFKLSTNKNLLVLSIKDDGQGMKAGKTTDGIGLQNMMSRVSVLNGKLNIHTKPGRGFALEVEIPIA